jgi:DNA repair protein RecO (recombination protein O)
MKRDRSAAFVLRTWPLRESDLIVSMYTRDRGKVRGVARGATRPKSGWSGALAPMTEIQAAWTEKEGEELLGLSDGSIVRSPYVVAVPLEVMWSLAFVAELVDATAPAHDEDVVLYRLLGVAVSAIVGGVHAVAVARYVQAWVLRLHGVMPDARACVQCGASLGQGGTWHWSLHGIACLRCKAGGDGVSLFPEDLAWLEHVRRNAPETLETPDPAVLRRVSVLLRQVTRELMGGRELKSERFLEELLALP